MATHYARPKDIKETLKLLEGDHAIPLAGGTFINTHYFKSKLTAYPESDEVTLVDLQSLGLDHIRKHGNILEIGACTSLQDLLDNDYLDENIKNAIRLEASINIRDAATVAGTLIACDGRSTFATIMLALDAKLVFEPGEKEILLGNFLPLRGKQDLGKLVTKVIIPLNTTVSFEFVARTKFDRPIVCVAVAKWASDRIRLALGGYGAAPILALDGTSKDDITAAARNGFHEASDEWATAEYRSDAAATLAQRCME